MQCYHHLKLWNLTYVTSKQSLGRPSSCLITASHSHTAVSPATACYFKKWLPGQHSGTWVSQLRNTVKLDAWFAVCSKTDLRLRLTIVLSDQQNWYRLRQLLLTVALRWAVCPKKQCNNCWSSETLIKYEILTLTTAKFITIIISRAVPDSRMSSKQAGNHFLWFRNIPYWSDPTDQTHLVKDTCISGSNV